MYPGGDQVPAIAPGQQGRESGIEAGECVGSGGWDRGRLFYLVMVERAVLWPAKQGAPVEAVVTAPLVEARKKGPAGITLHSCNFGYSGLSEAYLMCHRVGQYRSVVARFDRQTGDLHFVTAVLARHLKEVLHQAAAFYFHNPFEDKLANVLLEDHAQEAAKRPRMLRD